MSDPLKLKVIGRGRSGAAAAVSSTSSLSAFRTIGRGIQSTARTPSSTTESTSAARSSNLSDAAFYKTRPNNAADSKLGESGKEIKLSSNYFKLTTGGNFSLTQYRVDFTPEVDDVRMRKAFIRSHSETFGGYLYDGCSSIYLTRALDTEMMELSVTSNQGHSYKIKIKNSKIKIDLSDQAACQVLNLILRRAMDGLKMQLVGRNLYSPENKVVLSDYKVELWPGYITSIRQHEQDILVCGEVSHKVMRQQTIYEIMKEHQTKADWQDSFKREIIGSIVLTDYNNKTYRIDDVDFTMTPQSTFPKWNKATQTEEEITILDYYLNHNKNIRIKDAKQPLLVAKARFSDNRKKEEVDKILLLVPELCRATGLTDTMRADFRMMKAMAVHTQMDPINRTNRLLELTASLNTRPESVEQLRLFNVHLERDLVTFKGRALPQETMIFGNNKTSVNDDKVDWTNPMKFSEMCVTVPLKRWVMIYPQRASADTDAFLKLMLEVSGGMNFEVAKPKLVALTSDQARDYLNAIDDQSREDPRFIVMVVPNNATDRYAAIKKQCCITRGIPTQVIVLKTIRAKKDGNMSGVKSIATKVMIQINCKLGGAAWTVKLPMNGVMTIGFDVNHDTKDKGGKSYGAFVASMDLKKVIQYYSKVTSHKDGTELSDNIELSMTEALYRYKELHDSLPERIFFYRDGVSDSQIKWVHSHELSKINQRLADIYSKDGAGAEPKFAFIIVNKRINTRFFLNSRGTVMNPYSGTVIDNTVTLPERYDFYLISQSVRQGTVSPTSYNVIYDSSGLGPDKIQRYTYKTTHLYYNWSGTVRVPAVVQYAHKLALLVGDYIKGTPNSELNNLLYFL